MSNSDNPFDKKRDDRTVIRPSAPAKRQPPAPAETPSAPSRREPQNPPVERNVVAPKTSDPRLDDWIRAEAYAPPAATSTLPTIDLIDLVGPHENPILRAAAPLLMLLGRLHTAVLAAPFASLMEQVAEAMRFFEKDIRAAGIPEEQARAAKYVLCATADDIVQNIPTDDRHVWTQYSMLARFFNERTGGVRFFEEVDRAKMDPLRNFPLLELQYTCLALGFQGMHRSSPNGQSSLQHLKRELYEILRQVRPRLERELSPRWQGQMLAREKGWMRIPAWAAWGAAGLALFGIYVVLRMLLTGGSDVAIGHLRALHSQEPITIERRIFAEPPVPPPAPPPKPADPVKLTQLQRIRNGLALEIAAGQVDAVQTATTIVIRVGDLVLFPSSKATLLPEFERIGTRIATVLDKEPRKIKVVGHTDNTPLSSTSRFSSNQELSLERAKAVGAVLKSKLADPSRLVMLGRADEDPIAPNATKDGRAKNRRVEISLERDD
jgi:type VI secretion system protein ImpK